MVNEINKTNRELQLRIKKQILEPLEILEQVPQGRSSSAGAIRKVLKDFKKANTKIWDEVIQKINMKQIAPILLISILFLPGCACSYEFKKFGNGYVIQNGAMMLSEFTCDEKGNYPSDLELAKERFHRRKIFVEEWYKQNRPNSLANKNLEMAVGIAAIPLAPIILPLFIIAESCDETYRESVEGQREIEKANVKDLEAWRELRKYIEEDCKKEYLMKGDIHG